MKIERSEAEAIDRTGSWVLVYGRRKTGKTFILKNFVGYDNYFYVRRDGMILAEGMVPERIERADDFTAVLKPLLTSEKTVVIDEFQHLPSSVLEEISTMHPHGKLILSGSSMKVVHEVFSSNSPLLGMLSEHRIGLIRPGDILCSLDMPPEKRIEYAAYMRDPWTIPLFGGKGDFLRDLWNVIEHSKNAIPGLIGEIFSEEERRQSRTYDVILRLIGSGVWSGGEIAHILSQRGIIDKDDSRLVAPYIKNMKRMELIEEIPLFNSKRKSFYRVKSPIMETFYYLVDRHNIEERDVSFGEIKENLRKMANLAVERFVSDAFAQLYHGNREYSLEPEIDFIITEGRKRRALAFGEVKWGSGWKKGAVSLLEKTEIYSADRILFTKSGDKFKGVRIIDPKKLINELCKKS